MKGLYHGTYLESSIDS